MEVPKKPRCIIKLDANGTHYTVPLDDSHPKVEVWWNRKARVKTRVAHGRRSTVAEQLFVRQANNTQVDLLQLSPGQVYDLIDALNRAVESR